jgi:hypothetical protein
MWKGSQVSVDGSAFDSTQYAELMKCVDVKFWTGCLEWLISLFTLRENFVAGLTPREAACRALKALCDTSHIIFVLAPGIDQGGWTQKEEQEFAKYFRGFSKADYMPLTLDGTTFSGDPTMTTLGNTFRQICYTKFFLRSEPSENYNIAVAGDDVVIFVKTSRMERINHLILS